MNIESENKKRLYILEGIKWCSIVTLFMALIVGNYLFRDCSVSLRGVVIACVIAVIVYIVSITRIGKLLVIFIQESRIELNHVIWPSSRDGLNTTLIVVAVTAIVSLILWGLDAIVVNVISFGLRL